MDILLEIVGFVFNMAIWVGIGYLIYIKFIKKETSSANEKYSAKQNNEMKNSKKRSENNRGQSKSGFDKIVHIIMAIVLYLILGVLIIFQVFFSIFSLILRYGNGSGGSQVGTKSTVKKYKYKIDEILDKY